MTSDRETPRRVLFVITSSDVGGTESVLEALCARLDRRRFEPLVCSLRPPGRVAERIAERGVPVFSLQMAARARPWALVTGVLRLARLLDRHRIDLVQSLLYRANLLAAVAARIARRRPVVVAGQRSLEPMTGRLAGLGVRATRGLAARTVAVSEAVRRRLVEDEGVDPERVVVIGNGVDAERFRPGDRAAARARLGVAETSFVVGGLGRLTAAKGFEDLIDAAARVRGQGVALELVLIGDGPRRAALETRANELGLGDAVRFLGRRAGPEALYPGLDVFVLSSHREGSPNALLEAMACGRAAVATAVGGVPEIVELDRSGILVPPADPAALAAALLRLAEDPELRDRLGRGARTRIETAFTVQHTVRRHEALYEQLLS